MASQSRRSSHSSISSQDSLSSSGWQDADAKDDKDDSPPTICLFCPQQFTDAKSVFKHCKDEHDFDWNQIADLDFYGKVKLINFLRSNPKTVISALNKSSFTSDIYLQPSLEDDGLLLDLDDEDEDDDAETDEVNSLRKRLAEMEVHFEKYKEEVGKNFLQDMEKRHASSINTAPSSWGVEEKERDDDTDYFQSYSGNDIHETMLKDSVRTDSYRDFIYENKHIFKDKVVLDVGCGTGILSMFCAKAGAKKVFAVDNSAIINKARANIFENGLDDVITCFRGKIEEVSLPDKHVDIIVSEWMGYCLLYEAMLDSVLYARDKYLAPNGLMIPSICKLLIAAVHDSDYINDSVEFWNNVYGFRMSAMKEKIREDVVITHLPISSLVSEPVCFLNLPLHTINSTELIFTAPFELEINQTVESLDAFVIYFDNYFLTRREETVSDRSKAETWKGEGVAFTTGPGGKETHWREGLCLVESKSGLLKKGQIIKGKITYRKQKTYSRALDVEIEWEAEGKEQKQLWLMR